MKYLVIVVSLAVSAIIFFGFTPKVEVTSFDSIEVSGQVVDNLNKAIVGALILEIGTQNKVQSDHLGQFKLIVQKKNVRLHISHLNFPQRIIKIQDEKSLSNLKIVMQSEQMYEEEDSYENVMDMQSGQETSHKAERKVSVPTPTSVIREHPKRKRYDDKTNESANYSEIEENSFKNVIKDPLSTMSIDVDRASYANVRRFIQNGELPPANAVRVEEMINYFNYDYKSPNLKASERPFSTYTNLTSCPWNSDHQLLHVALQGAEIERDEIPASNFVFLIDVSGSMSSANKLPLLKSAFRLFVNQLDDRDRVAIVVYAGAAGCVLESTPGSDKAKIMEAFDKLQSGGSTAGAAGIEQAYDIATKNFIKKGNNRVLLATDGDFNVGISSDDALVSLIEKKRSLGIYLSVIGVGQGNYKDGKMQKLANAGNGNHNYIDNMSEAKKVFIDEFGATSFTIAKDVKIQIEFNPASVSAYRMVGYENRVLQAEDFNDDTKDAGEMGMGHTVTVLYEIIPVGSKSSFANSVDPLKYQENDGVKIKKSDSKELATIKYRYKKSDEDRSTRSEEIIANRMTNFSSVDKNIQWATMVAEFGLLLRDSKYKNTASYASLINRLEEYCKSNSDPYKSEMLDLVSIASVMSTSYASKEE